MKKQTTKQKQELSTIFLLSAQNN